MTISHVYQVIFNVIIHICLILLRETRMLQKKRITALISLLTLSFLSACAGPRAVVNITSRGDQVKLVYYQKKFLGYDQGIIQCKATEDGTLDECRKLNVKFSKK